MPPEQMESVTVRLPRLVAKKIAAEAEASGLERSVFMRRLLIDALERGASEERLTAEVRRLDEGIQTTTGELREELDKLRQALANSVLRVLVELNKGLPVDKRSPPEALKSTVVETFRKK